MHAITRTFAIDTGHRLLNHPGKCRNLHGHRYDFEVTCVPKDGALNDQGMVADFGVIKQRVGDWLNTEWDHAFLVEALDPLAAFLEKEGTKHRTLPVPPTVENLAAIFHRMCKQLLEDVCVVVNVRVYETPTSWCDYR